MIYLVILCGGSGIWFWLMLCGGYFKQYLKFMGDSMFVQ